MFALGALGAGALGAGALALRAKRRRAAANQTIDSFDYADLDEPVIVTEEVIIVEAIPLESSGDERIQ